MSWDLNYYLIFTTDGRTVVRSIKSFEQPYRTPDIQEYGETDLEKVVLAGKTLTALVEEKIKAIPPEDLTPQ